MRSSIMFSRASDDWATPDAFFAALNAEFAFGLDAAASPDNAKLPVYLTDALQVDWGALSGHRAVWCNPPYSRCREFIAKASLEASRGLTVVCLVPSRTDTRWWHDYVWDRTVHHTRSGVQIRYIKIGRAHV